MTSAPSSRPRTVVGALVLLLFAGVIVWVATRSPPPEPSAEAADIPPVLEIEDNGLRYTVHLPTGQEGLFDIREDPRCLKNLVSEDAATVKRLRSRLEERLRRDLGVKDIDELRATYRERMEQLRALGYL